MTANDISGEELIRAAIDAATHAYAPYSGFSVGAALLAASGKVYTGANVENAAYSNSICAERVALFKAVSEGERNFTMLAVAAADGSDAPPCGSCRQALAEFSPLMTVIYSSGGSSIALGLDQLLPDTFKSDRSDPRP
jgi:cytidine deaminase